MRSRRSIVDMAGARIAALLQASSAPSSGHFKAVLDWARAFIEAAEAFSGTQDTTLRGHLERAGDRYFESLHSQRLEALQQMIDREVWARLPEAAAQQARVDLRAAASRGKGEHTQGFGVAAFGGVSEDGSAFEALVTKGNPFSEGSNTGGVDGDSTAESSEDATKGSVDHDPSKNADNEEDEEDAAVSAAFIDEGDDDNDTIDPEMRRARREARAAAAAAEASAAASRDCHAKGLDARSPTLTASSLYLLQGVAEYLRLMRVLPPRCL